MRDAIGFLPPFPVIVLVDLSWLRARGIGGFISACCDDCLMC